MDTILTTMTATDAMLSGVYGFAIGDALGFPVNFFSKEELSKNPVKGISAHTLLNVPTGAWSDNTAMVLSTLDGLKHGIEPCVLMERLISWMDKGSFSSVGEVFDAGYATMVALARYKRHHPVLECGNVDDVYGSDALIRILPVAIFLFFQTDKSLADRINLIHDVASLTHRHPKCLISCGIYGEVIHALLSLKSLKTKESIVKNAYALLRFYYKEAFSYEKYLKDFYLLNSLSSLSDVAASNLFRCNDSVWILQAALWCFLTTDTYKECVLKAVNFGFKTNTLAAVAGSLAGVYYGQYDIPSDWLSALVKKDYIEQLCLHFQEEAANAKAI